MEQATNTETSSKEYLSLIWQKEIELDQKLEDARREAKKIIDEAQEKAAGMIQKAQTAQQVFYKAKKEEKEKLRKQEVVEGLKEEKLTTEELSRQEREEVEDFKQKALSVMNKAVDLVLEKILA